MADVANTKRLYVGNLPWSVDETKLQEVFSQWGASSATIPMNDAGKSKGFGFVDVDAAMADDAIKAMNGDESMGRPLTVNEARPREERPAPQA
jgi:RNA recognition motif-containing protein